MKKFLLPIIFSSFLLGACNNNNASSIQSISEDTSMKEEHACEKTRLDLYIISGQSNAVGYSPISGLPNEEKNHTYETGWYFAKGEGSNYAPAKFDNWRDTLKAGDWGYNQSSFGPEIGMSKFLEDKYEPTPDGDRQMAILKYSQGGSALYNRWFSSTIAEKGNGVQLQVDAAGNPCPNRTLDDKVVGDLYYNLVTTIREQIDFLSENYCVHIIGLAFNQGCHDGTNQYYASLYEENITDFISDLRKDINAPDMPVCLMQVARSVSGAPYTGMVADAQAKVGTSMKNVTYVDISSLTTLGVGDPHWSGSSMLELGALEASKLYDFKTNE